MGIPLTNLNNYINSTNNELISSMPKVTLLPVEPPIIKPIYQQELTPQEQAKKDLADLTGSYLNVDFLNTTVVKKILKNGKQKYFLRISRPGNDKDREYDSSREKITMGYIRKHLGVKEKVISTNNDSIFVSNRRPEYFFDDASLECGRFLDIPVSELGQDNHFWKSLFSTKSEWEELKEAVKNIEKSHFEKIGSTVVKPTTPKTESNKASAEAKKEPENTSNTYIVKQGDSLSAIANKHGITLAKLLELNPDINPKDILKIGIEIVVPTNLTKTQIQNKIKQQAKEYDLDESLVLGLVEQESNFNPSARSKTGAVGLFQLTKIAAKQVNGEKTYNVDKNIEYGLKYLKWCIDHTKTEEEALVVYNRGLSAMKTAKAEGKKIDSITDKKNGKGFAENVLELRKKYQ